MKKKIVYALLVLIVFISVVFLVLKNGILISHIQFSFLNLEQLYIKLDKKLIVRAKNITFNEDNNASIQDDKNVNSDFASKELLNITKNLKYLYTFVEEIDIQNFNIKDNHMRILFKNDEFFVDNDLLFLKLALHREGKEINADIKNLLLKDYNLSIDGNLSINAKSEFYNFKGQANSDLADFKINISYKNQNLAYKFEDINIRDITTIFNQAKKRIALPEPLVLWVAHRAKGDFYHFDFIQGFIDFSKNNYYFDDISAWGYANNVKVRLDNQMNAINFPKLDLNLSNQKLNFTFNKASYNESDLSESKVFLYDLFDNKKHGIYLRIKSKNLKFDEKLAKALKNYDLNLPFYQKNGKLGSDLELIIDFNEKGDVKYNGTLSLENAELSLANFSVARAFVKLNQNDLSIENASVKNEFLEADFNAKIDLATHKGIFDTQISRLYFDNGELFDMRNQKTKINLDYTDDLQLSVPEWDLTLNFKEGLEAYANNPNILIPHSPLLKKFGFMGAKSIYYKSVDFNDFNAQIQDAHFKNNLLVNNKPYENDSFGIVRKSGVLNINTQSGLANVKVIDNNKTIHLKNLTYIYQKDENASTSSFDIAKNTQNIILNGENLTLILADFNKTLNFDKMEANLKSDILDARAIRKNANFDLHYSPNDLKLFIKNINDEHLNEFLQKRAVQEGVFNFSVIGSGLDYFEGEFNFKDTFIRDLKGVNQLISFIDTVPSLLMFKTPTFNEKGLSLHDGKVVFNRKKDLLSFEAINLNGNSMDLYGLGSANLRLNTIDIDLELKTLKSASETISKVPILNYVILGKNQEISANIKVDGALDDPKFHTQILSDTLKTPFNLIKNIIQLPSNLFN
ncbi:TPA: AsmA-like C-terminal domain-containing protein [Campylobacter coli]|nr:AsmA-like C-terminal domain-containing protein [Campylobacter coli]